MLQRKNVNLFSQFAFGFDNYYQCNLEIIGSMGRIYTNRIFTAGINIKPVILIETHHKGSREIILEPDNHFKNMLLYFYGLTLKNEDKELEYENNINQSHLISDFRKLAGVYEII